MEVAAARNEYESIQVVIEAPWRPVTIREVRLSDLRGPGGAVIPASALKWERVDYVETTVQPMYFAERGLGWYPDPLMPAGAFTVGKLSRTPVWITLKTPRDCPAGKYRGTITLVPERLPATTVPLALTVWDFALTDQTHLRTMTWMSGGEIRAWYGHDWSAEGDRLHGQAMRNYQDFLLEHRLGPGGEISLDDKSLERLIAKGMNAFVMGTAPNLKREQKDRRTARSSSSGSPGTSAPPPRASRKRAGWTGPMSTSTTRPPAPPGRRSRRSTGRSMRPLPGRASCSASTSRKASKN